MCTFNRCSSLSTSAILAQWSCDSISADALLAMALTDVSSTISAPAANALPSPFATILALEPLSLTPGLEYTFKLVAGFLDQKSASSSFFSTITVSISEPPSGGTLTVIPPIGEALNTTYEFTSRGWVTDLSSYPLLYYTSYYTTDASQRSLVSAASPFTKVSAILGQGTVAMNYSVTCTVTATNLMGDSASTSTSVQVRPVRNLNALSAAGILLHLYLCPYL